MAKLSSVNKNNRRIKLANKFYSKRKKLINGWQKAIKRALIT